MRHAAYVFTGAEIQRFMAETNAFIGGIVRIVCSTRHGLLRYESLKGLAILALNLFYAYWIIRPILCADNGCFAARPRPMLSLRWDLCMFRVRS